MAQKRRSEYIFIGTSRYISSLANWRLKFESSADIRDRSCPYRPIQINLNVKTP